VGAEEFGKRLRELRKQAGMTQRGLAAEVGVDFSYLSKIENGALPPPSEKVISKLAETLNASRDELLSLAGRIPSEIGELLTRPEALKFLRSQRGQKVLGTSNKKPGGLQMRGKDFFKNYKGLARAAVAVVLVLAVGTSLWFAAPAQAIELSVPNTSGNIGSTATITATVNVQSGDILPIKSINLEIYDSTNSETFTGLPLKTVSGVSYTGTNGSTARISARTGSGWGYGYGTRKAYGYGYESGWGTSGGYHDLGTGSTFGYGYTPGTQAATSIAYTVVWNVPSNWPSGNYTIRLRVYGNGESFVKDGTLALSPLGEGGAGPAPPPAPAPGTTDVSGSVDEEGVFTESVTAASEDVKCWITINGGTIGKTAEGEPLTEITIVPMAEPPAPPAASNVVCLTYDIGPDGATFEPPALLNIIYDESLIPEGVAEENLVIALWDEDAGEWVPLPNCTVNPDTNTITVEISHFAAFTVMAYTSPAAFAASNLAIAPAEVGIGEEVTVSVLITNSGDLTSSYEAVLKIDGAEVAREEVTLIGSASETVTFTTTRDAAGTYAVSVDGLSGTFTVKAAPAPPTPAPPTPAKPINWPLIGGIIAGVIVVALVIWRVVVRRRD